jgi:hypothetical protein
VIKKPTMASRTRNQVNMGKGFNPFRELAEAKEENKIDRDFKSSRSGSIPENPFPNDGTWGDPWSSDPWSTEPSSFQPDQWSRTPELMETSFDSSMQHSSASGKAEPLETSFESAFQFSSESGKAEPLDSSFESTFQFSDPSQSRASSDLSLQYSESALEGEDRQKAPVSTPLDPFDDRAFASNRPFLSDSDAFMKLSPPREAQHKMGIRLEERLSISFDDLSPDPTCRVIGFIYVSGPNETR